MKKRSSMKKIKISTLIICGTILTMLHCGCGRQENDEITIKQANVEEIQSEESGKTIAENVEEMTKENEQEEQAISDKESEVEVSERPLTTEELKQFMDYLNRFDNYGFLLSEYESPEYVDLAQVFYSGAGIEFDELTEEERANYQEKAGEIYTEIIRLTSSQINDFLQMKAGITLVDMKNEFQWIYLEDYDCYVCQSGDTNYTSFTCTSGVEREKGIFEIHCAADYECVDDCVVTLKMAEDGTYRFLTNRFEENNEDRMAVRKITEQCFDIELEKWGAVQFVSYAPNTYIDMWGDVTFALLKDGERIYDFPQIQEENQLANAQFSDVNAVAFKDYDKDGYTDVIIICEYELVSGPDVAQHYKEARIYKGNENGFVYMSEESYWLNAEGSNETIAQILEQIELEPLDLTGLDENTRRQLEIFVKCRGEWLLPEYEMETGCFAVEDLDGDGRLELIVWTMGGTGRFSDNYFYRINESGTGIEELIKEEVCEWDLGTLWGNDEPHVFLEPTSGRRYYLVKDYCNMGGYSTYAIDGYLYIEDGVVYEESIAGYEYLYGEEHEIIEEKYYDAVGNEISKEQWEQLYVEFMNGKEAVSIGLKWSDMDYSEALEASEGAILRMLAETLNVAP